VPFKKPITVIYLVGAIIVAIFLFSIIGRDVLPKTNAGQFQLRIRDADGTRIEKTEQDVLKTLNVMYDIVGKENVAISSSMIGIRGTQFSTNPIYLFMAGPQEAVLQVTLIEGYKTDMCTLKDAIRKRMAVVLPNIKLSFEPIELTDKILSQGLPTPIEVKIMGKNMLQNEIMEQNVIDKLKQIPYLRDVQLDEAIHYPAVNVNIERVRAAQLGTNVAEISRSFVAATSSSRLTENYVWIDPKSQLSYLVQVETPEAKMSFVSDINQIQLVPGTNRPMLGDVATIQEDSVYGQDDDIASIPNLSVTANLYKKDLGTATHDVENAIKSIRKPPRGLFIETRGLSEVLTETLSSLQGGLITAIVVIF
jgi:multidrug efflux pump subunit AcrB